MVIVAKTRLNEFAGRYAIAADPLNYWHDIVKNADWEKFSDIKKDFNSVDAVGNDRYVFNIKGNAFRLVAMIHFDIRTVYIRFLGTHAEYDRIKDISKI